MFVFVVLGICLSILMFVGTGYLVVKAMYEIVDMIEDIKRKRERGW